VLPLDVKKWGSEIGPARILGFTGYSVPDCCLSKELFFASMSWIIISDYGWAIAVALGWRWWC